MVKVAKSFVLLVLLFCALVLDAQVPFTKGVNLTNWFQADNVRQVQFSKYTRQDFVRIKSLGCDVVRLPINLHYMTNGSVSNLHHHGQPSRVQSTH